MTPTDSTAALTSCDIRCLQPHETAVILAVFAGLSPRSRFLRFNAGLSRLTPTMARRLADPGPDRGEVLVAVHDDRPVGIGRWAAVQSPMLTAVREAEVAFEVIDAAHGLGIGRALGTALIQSAHAAGIDRLVAQVHPENHRVNRWLARSGWARESVDGWSLVLRPLEFSRAV